MHTEFSYDDYLLLEIQKHLIELEELTTDVTYSKIVYKMLLDEGINSDNLTLFKGRFVDTVSTPNLKYFDYAENKTKFVLLQILDTLQYIKENIKDTVLDKPEVFFCKVFNKTTLEDSQNKSFYNTQNTKVTIANKKNNSTQAQRLSKTKIDSSLKKSTVVIPE